MSIANGSVQYGTMTSVQDDQINRALAAQVGLSVPEVEFLRNEFRKFGRNPLQASLEILAIENNFSEEKVKALFELHLTQLRRSDGLTSDRKSVYD
uniref:Uncharacterized protein n=1 Tax=Romanomermis culicivorax TaxID=13658 RepID=A0A915HSD8_ROMCU